MVIIKLPACCIEKPNSVATVQVDAIESGNLFLQCFRAFHRAYECGGTTMQADPEETHPDQGHDEQANPTMTASLHGYRTGGHTSKDVFSVLFLGLSFSIALPWTSRKWRRGELNPCFNYRCLRVFDDVLIR